MTEISLDKYQVVSGTLFSKNSATLTFKNGTILLNPKSISLLSPYNYGVFLFSEKDKRVVIKPCEEQDPYGVQLATPSKKSREIALYTLFEKVFNVMNWNIAKKYRVSGEIADTKDGLCLCFHLIYFEELPLKQKRTKKCNNIIEPKCLHIFYNFESSISKWNT